VGRPGLEPGTYGLKRTTPRYGAPCLHRLHRPDAQKALNAQSARGSRSTTRSTPTRIMRLHSLQNVSRLATASGLAGCVSGCDRLDDGRLTSGSRRPGARAKRLRAAGSCADRGRKKVQIIRFCAPGDGRWLTSMASVNGLPGSALVDGWQPVRQLQLGEHCPHSVGEGCRAGLGREPLDAFLIPNPVPPHRQLVECPVVVGCGRA